VFGQINGPGAVSAVSAASAVPGESEFAFVTDDGHLWHTVRHEDGTWSGLGDVWRQIQDPGVVAAVTAISPTAGETQFLFATADGHLWHATRYTSDGHWSALGDVWTQIEDPGPVRAVASASAAISEAQLIFTASSRTSV
jgi:hypothetical protein